MRINAAILLVSVLAWSFSSCGTKPTTPPKPAAAGDKPPAVEGPKLVGRVANVPADKRFVLIQSFGPWLVEAGGILTTYGPDERTANLRVTGEKLGEFAAADVQSGTIKQGDAVYSRPMPKPTVPAPSPEPPKPEIVPPAGKI